MNGGNSIAEKPPPLGSELVLTERDAAEILLKASHPNRQLLERLFVCGNFLLDAANKLCVGREIFVIALFRDFRFRHKSPPNDPSLLARVLDEP
jgi:hypothetical protein